MFNIRMALEAEGQVFNLNFSRIENGVLYFHLEDVRVQIQRDMQSRGLVEAEGGQPEETQTLSPGAEEGDEAIQPQETIASAATSQAPGGPEWEGVEPAPPAGRRRGERGSRTRQERR
jgi:hypothetical protein